MPAGSRESLNPIILPEQATLPTPGSGKVLIGAKSDGTVVSKDDTGAETTLGGGGSLLDEENANDIALKRARAAFGKRETRAFNILFVGDSLLEGYGPTLYEGRPAQRIRAILQQFDPVSRGIGYLPTRGGAGMDTRWTFVGTHDTTEYGFGLGRRSTAMNSSDDRSNLVFYGDRIWLFFSAGVGTQDATITLDGTPVTIGTQSNANRGGWVWDSGPIARREHTIEVKTAGTPTSHFVILDGAMVFDGDGSVPPSQLYTMTTTNASQNVSGTGFTAAMNGKKIFGPTIPAGATFTYASATTGTISANATGSGTKTVQVVGVNAPAGRGIRIWDGSHAGYQASAFGDTGATSRYWADALTEVTPDIVFIDFMHNDKNAAVSIANYKIYLKGIIDNMDLVLGTAQRPSIVFTPPYVTSGSTESTWEPWREAMEEVARDNGYAVLDLHQVLGDVHDATNDLIGVTMDNVHFSDAGAELFAEMAAEIIMPGLAAVDKIAPPPSIVFADRTADFTFALEDAGGIVRCDGTGVDATIPPNSTHPWPIGTQLAILNANVSPVTPVQGAGVTIRNLSVIPTNVIVVFVKSATNEWVQNVVSALPTLVRFVIDGGGSVITTGAKKAYITVPYNCTVTGWRILADVSGSIVIDIWKDTYANYPPTNADSITAAAKPTLTTAVKAESTTLTGWTTALAAGDILEIEVESATTVQKVRLELTVVPS